MPYKNFTAGSVFTAADANTYLMNQSVMTFTNEAARDAAITAPTEGMIAYLTAPTIPAATGATTFVPTGIRSIYNGSAWVCVTPVGSFTAASGTTASSSFTATLSGSPGTNPSVTVVTGTTALISIRASMQNTTATAASVVGVAVSGATTLAASIDYGMSYPSTTTTNDFSFGTTLVLAGLTAGTNTFTLNYLVSTGTGTIGRRGLIIHGIA